MAKKILRNISLFLFLPLLLTAACTKKVEQNVRELRIFTWSEYFDADLLKEFEQENGVKIYADYFSSNEEMLAKLEISMQGRGSGYDLILPSDYMVRKLIERNMLLPLQKEKLSFLQDLDPTALNVDHDKGLSYSVPMAMGTTGLAVNTKLAGKIDLKKLRWKDFFENPAFAGKTMLLEDSKEVLQVALLVLGKNLKNAQEADIRAAFAYLKKHKKNLKAFTSETRPALEAEDCVLCQAYSGDALAVAEEKKEIRFIIPQEGATQWSDNFAIPKNAKNIEMAHAFMNKILGEKGAVKFTDRTFYRTANSKAKKFSKHKNHELVFPSTSMQKKLHYLAIDKSLELLQEQLWAELKSL